MQATLGDGISPVGGLRANKKQATRRELTSAARRLGLARGLDALTVETICREVGVSVRTFFNYFESRDAAIIGDPVPIGSDVTLTRFVDGGPTGELLADLLLLLDPSDAFEREGREELARMFELIRNEPRILALQLARHAAQEEELAHLVATRRGMPQPDGSCRVVAAIAQTATRRACMDWFVENSPLPLSEYLDRTGRYVTELLPVRRPRPSIPEQAGARA